MKLLDFILNLFKRAPVPKTKPPEIDESVPDQLPVVAKPVPNPDTWMHIAYAELGEREVAGAKHNPRIVEYHSATDLGATDDETPWCSSFVNWVMRHSEIVGTNSARAASWLDWGVPLVKPLYGCVVVKKRENGNHVTFYVREEVRNGVRGFIGLGGNQSNQVCEAWYANNTVRGWRWPS